MRRVWLLLIVLIALFGRVQTARAADAAMSVVFLPIESDDAENQASALSAALRSKMRSGSVFALVDTNQTLGMLTAALRCGTRPESPCARKIGDQLKTERYIWGILQKSGTKDLSVDLHLYQKGKEEIVARETLSSSLRDPNDPEMKKLAARLLDTLAGRKIGTITIYAGSVDGTVSVDNKETSPMKKGTASFDLAPGEHTFRVSAPGRQTTTQSATVVANQETSLTISLPVLSDGNENKKPLPVRKIVGWSAIGVGALFEVIAVAEFAAYAGHISDGNDAISAYAALPGHAPLVCSSGSPNDASVRFNPALANAICGEDKAARQTSTAGWIFGGVGLAAIGTGVYLLVTDKTAPESSEKKTMHLSPTFGPQGGSLSLSGTF